MAIRAQRAVAAIVALTAGLATAVSSTGPAASAAAGNGRIAFNRNGDIYVANQDGTHARRITFFNGDAGYPRWSPDGKKILFSARGSVWWINPDGNGWAVLFPGERPAWSPDSQSVVYRSSVEDYEDITVRRLSTGVTAVIDRYGDSGGCPYEYDPGPTAVFVPDGTSVIYDAREYGGKDQFCGVIPSSTEVVLRPAAGGEPHYLTTWKAAARFADVDSAPTGSLYVVATDAGYKDGRGRLYLGNRKTGHRWRLTSDVGVSAPTFAPDGRSVYYSQQTIGGQWLVRRVSLRAPDRPRTVLDSGSEPTVEPLH